MSEKLTTKEIQDQISELTRQNKLMRQLATAEGFYKYYFSQLPNHPTALSCFNAINDMYFDFFGEYKYSCYNSFQAASKRRK